MAHVPSFTARRTWYSSVLGIELGDHVGIFLGCHVWYYTPPQVRRESVEVAPGRRLSALVWGHEAPELVLVHGGAQNAHTWDTVAMALGIDRRRMSAVMPFENLRRSKSRNPRYSGKNA